MKLKKDGTPKKSGGQRPNSGCKPKPYELKKSTLRLPFKNSDLIVLGGVKNTETLIKKFVKEEVIRRKKYDSSN